LTEKAELKNLLRQLFSTQLLAVPRTQGQSGPYGNVVASAITDDLKSPLFATAQIGPSHANPRSGNGNGQTSNNEDWIHRTTESPK
jgi:hypothetical protein